jgi:Uma2 family endonuclease
MVSAASQTAATPASAPSVAERRVVFHNLSWQSYLQILQALGDQRSARLTFDRGTLEITMPLEEHEFFRVMIGLFIRILVEESGLKLKSMGSTTLNYPNLERGAEPDDAYYIQSQASVASRKVDLTQDPPPDLIVEVDITHTDINKLNLYASMGVPEFWRYNGQVLHIYQLQNQAYVELETSPNFSAIPKSRLYEFLRQCQDDEVQASKDLRNWMQQLQSDQQ